MLLDFSRMELGRVPIRPAPFQIGRLVAQVVAGIEADARKRRIRLQTVVEPDLKPVDGDRDRLTQVLENLITNALKFTPDRARWRSARGSSRRAGASRSGSPTPGSGSRPREGPRLRQVLPERRVGDAEVRRHRPRPRDREVDPRRPRAEIVVDGRQGAGSVFRFSLPAAEARTESGVFRGLLPPTARPRTSSRSTTTPTSSPSFARPSRSTASP